MLIKSKKNKIVFILFYLSFWLICFLLAYWFGLGWIVLHFTILGLFISIPRLHNPVFRFLYGENYSNKSDETQYINNNRWFTSKKSIFIIIFNVLFTILVFWKGNISISTILKLALHR